MTLALGIDVGGRRKGFHAVALSQDRRVTLTVAFADAKEVGRLIGELNPAVVAIDAPCGWSTTKSRQAERDLARRGVTSFSTPTRGRGLTIPSFYGWMFQGEAAFDVAKVSRPLFVGGRSTTGQTIEVFPYATSVALQGGPKPKDRSKVIWRRSLLAAAGVDDLKLTNIDLVDAALCALTGLFSLEGRFECFGNAQEGILVAPNGIPERSMTNVA